MAICCDSETKTKATASIQAEFDRINRNFGRSLRMCNEAAELLMTGAGQEFNGTRQLKLIQTCSLFRGIPIAVNRATRVRT